MQNIPYIVATEILMTPIIIYFVLYIIKNLSTITYKQGSIVLFLLAMMSGMLNTVNYYIILPNGFLNNVIAFNISMFEMSVIISYILLTAFNNRINHLIDNRMSRWIGVMVVWNEISMGLLLISLAVGFNTSNIYNGSILTERLISIFSDSITSYLFVIPMATEMVTAYVLKHSSDKFLMKISLLIILMQISDPAIDGNILVIPFSVIFSIIMAISIYYIISYFLKNRDEMKNYRITISKLFLAYLLFSAFGLIMEPVIPGSFGLRWSIFSASMVFAMILYFLMAFRGFKSFYPDASPVSSPS
ncbi:hypothetical protein [Caldiplasma sukawensis]